MGWDGVQYPVLNDFKIQIFYEEDRMGSRNYLKLTISPNDRVKCWIAISHSNVMSSWVIIFLSGIWRSTTVLAFRCFLHPSQGIELYRVALTSLYLPISFFHCLLLTTTTTTQKSQIYLISMQKRLEFQLRSIIRNTWMEDEGMSINEYICEIIIRWMDLSWSTFMIQ